MKIKNKALKEDYEDLDANWEFIEEDIINEVKKYFPDFHGDVYFDDSRGWSLYVSGSELGLGCSKFGAFRNYAGGGVRGPVQHNGREQDGTVELGEFFAKKLLEIEDLINAGSEDAPEWDKPTGVLLKHEGKKMATRKVVRESTDEKEKKIDALIAKANRSKLEKILMSYEDDIEDAELDKMSDSKLRSKVKHYLYDDDDPTLDEAKDLTKKTVKKVAKQAKKNKEYDSIEVSHKDGNWYTVSLLADYWGGKSKDYYKATVKMFRDPSSKYGINKGRISKLEVKLNNKVVANYDRGWDIQPKGKDKEFVDEMIKQLEEYAKGIKENKQSVKRVIKESRKLDEEVSDEAYQVAERINDAFQGTDFISRDDFDEQFALAIRDILGVDNIWSNPDAELPNGEDVFDFENDVRGILAFDGWETQFEGEDEGGLIQINAEPPKKNEIIYKALKVYEETNWDSIGKAEQKVLNELIDYYEYHQTDESYNGRKGKKSLKESVNSKKRKLRESITVTIDEDEALDMLMTRLEHWTDDPIARELYEQMYTSYIDGGAFDGTEFNVMAIVDNDWVNYCEVVEPGNDEYHYDKLVELYNEDGCGDISTEDTGFSYIEAVTENGSGELVFLCRW